MTEASLTHQNPTPRGGELGTHTTTPDWSRERLLSLDFGPRSEGVGFLAPCFESARAAVNCAQRYTGEDEGEDYLDRVGLMAKLLYGKADAIYVDGKYVPVVVNNETGELIGRVLTKVVEGRESLFGLAFAKPNGLLRDVQPGEIWIVDGEGLFRA